MSIRKKHLVQYGCALLSLVCACVLSAVSGTLAPESQQAAERWQGEGELHYAQISLFMGEEAGFSTISAEGIKESVDTTLRNASLEAAEGSRLWYSAYSTQLGQMSLHGTKLYGATAVATAIGGDFFLMHPMTLLDGNYISEADLMDDFVVLDEAAAWHLFGSSDVSGMEVIVNDMRCIVAGVVRPETDYATEQAYGDVSRFYLSYSLYEKMYGESMVTVNCYEAVLPEPVRGFAEKTINNAVGTRDSMRVVKNTDRGALSTRWHNLWHIHEMLVNPDSAAFPYWENAARIVDYDRAILLGFTVFFLVYPVLCGLWLLWKGYSFVNRFIAELRKAHKNKYRSEIPQV